VLSLHSQTKEMTREKAIQQLSDGELEIIFTVDLFNEGVDIPEVDTLLFCSTDRIFDGVYSAGRQRPSFA
jgi:superfamily II DNA or RNA helicase